MNHRQGIFANLPLAGAVFALVGFVVFQCLLTVLAPALQRELAAQNMDPQMGADFAPALWHARIWFALVFGFLLLVFKYANFGFPEQASLAPIILFIAAAYLLVLTRALQFPVCIDDAYIDFRQARNLALHGSLDYNLGDPVMGFTSDLHLWILALLGWVGGFAALPLWSQNFNILCDLLSFGLVYKLGRQLKLAPLPAVFGSVWFALSAYLISATADGKEASLLVLLLLVLIWAVETRRPALVAWASVLIFLARPEGVLVAAVAVMWCGCVLGLGALKSWRLPAAVAGAWYALLWFHFGTIWPQGMLAKAVIYPHPPMAYVAEGIGVFLLQSFGLPVDDFFWFYTYFGVVATMVLAVLLVATLWRQSGPRLYLVCLLLLSAAFVGKKIEMGPFPWYYAWYVLAPILVLPRLLDSIWSWLQRAGRARGMLMAVIVGLALLVPLNRYRSSRSLLPGHHYPNPFFLWDDTRQRLLAYRDLAQFIKAESGISARVATSEDGMFGYAYDGPVLTLDGLAFRDIARYYPLPEKMRAINFAIAPALVLEQKPDYVVFLEVFGRNSLLKDPEFTRQYVLEKTLSATAFESRGMLLYRRIPVTAALPNPARH